VSLIFNPENHSYFMDGKELPSVTQVIDGAGFVSDFCKQDRAADYGRKVHEAVSSVARGTETYETDKRIECAVDGFREWKKAYKPETCYSEMPMASKSRGYAGTIDLLAKIKGKYWLVDVKTGGYCPWHIIQLAAYNELVKSEKLRADKFACLYLDPVEAGKFTFREVNRTEIQGGFSVFLNALNVYRWKNSQK
jgi:hypothetical protein